MVDLPPTVGVVPVLALCLEPARLALVMKLMERGTVFDVVQRIPADDSKASAGLPEEFVGRSWAFRVYLAHKCASRLSALHAVEPPKGPVIHRDIKAANFLVDKGWNVFLADLGLAKSLAENTISKYTGMKAAVLRFV